MQISLRYASKKFEGMLNRISPQGVRAQIIF